MFYTNPSFLVLFVFFLFIWEYTILKKEKSEILTIKNQTDKNIYQPLLLILLSVSCVIPR